MKKILSFVLVLALFASMFAMTAEASTYPFKSAYNDLDARVTGYTRTLEYYGIKNVKEYLTKHKWDIRAENFEYGTYYEGTPYWGGDHMSPNFDPQARDGYTKGMNCGGFVAHVLMKCGLSKTVANKMVANDRATKHPRMSLGGWGNTKDIYSYFTNASDWYAHILGNKLQAYVYKNMGELAKDGKCENGDIVIFFTNFPQNLEGYEDNHAAIYWGDGVRAGVPYHGTRIWDSAPYYGNHTSVPEDNFSYYGNAVILVKAKPLPVPEPDPDPVTGFNDIDTEGYYYEAVKWAVSGDITSGTAKNKFSPDAPCTRAQAVTFLWRANGSPEPASAETFSDVPEGSYYEKAVKWASENGITSGTGGGKFSPNNKCTRAQIVAFLYRAAGSPYVDGEDSRFEDVSAESYYADAVGWASGNGVTSGTGGGKFSPDANCTRCQIVTFLWRAAGSPIVETETASGE